MNDTKVIRTISMGLCPHCSKEIVISFNMNTPNISWVLKPQDIAAAKTKLKNEINKIEFIEATDKDSFLRWIDNKETLLGPEEVQPILNQILEDNKKRGETQNDGQK